MAAARRFVLIAAGLLFAAGTAAEEPSSPIEELFSSADARLQFIQLVNVSPSQLAGMSLTTSHDGVTQTFTFPAGSHLPNPPFTPYVVIVSQSLSQQRISPSGGASEWDYVMPDGFLPLSDGTISLGSIDRWDYGRIPADGFSALYREGGIGVHRAHSSAHGVVVSFGFDDQRFATEYASDSFDRHFFTTSRDEMAALDSGRTAGWHPIYRDFVPVNGDYTGFAAFGRRVEVFNHSVCRFYLPPPDDSHFFTASDEECADVQARFPQVILETDNAFYAGLPNPLTGKCAPGLWPLYRLWNPATNDHWYTADGEARAKAMTQGYVSEGYGDLGVGMCVIGGCYHC